MQEPAGEPSVIVTPQLAEGAELLRLTYIPLSQARLWDRNAKLHDIGALAESIRVSGFRDPPAYDVALGGIVEGNGRTEALIWMQTQGQELPRGIAKDASTGEWCMPMIFGVDAPSRLAAERYGIDHNNLVMSGGDFTAVDAARNYGPGYLQIVQDLADAKMLPTSIDRDDVKAIVADALERAKAADAPGSDGSLLALTNVVIDDPRYVVEPGDTWAVGAHILICADVMTGWKIWLPHLAGDETLFVPYPGPFAPLSIRAEKHCMVMVQPDPYIAGHILDRFAEQHGSESVSKM